MIKLNDNNIIVGQIKQVLKDFNLPNCPVYKEDKSKTGFYIDDQGFLKLDYTVKQSNTDIIKTKTVEKYIYNKVYKGLTTNLRIDNYIYDRYTHRYLGKYLRFLRDFRDVDLFSLYNCFDEAINEIEINIASSTSNVKIYFNGINQEDGTITYSIPVQPEIYTIKIPTYLPIEYCLTIENYNESTEGTPLNDLAKVTFSKKSFYKPTLLDVKTLFNENNKFYSRIEDVRLLIKVPTSVTKGIVILTGDYSYQKPFETALTSDQYKYHLENTLTNKSNFNLNPQLLSYVNTGNNLLADRFLEYITENAITPDSEYYDIQKIQKHFLREQKEVSPYFGIWGDKETKNIKAIIINDMVKTKGNANGVQNKFDILGYCDKDIEAKLGNLRSIEEFNSEDN